MRIACVDDDAMFRRLVGRKLAKRKVSFSDYASSEDFLGDAQGDNYDLVLVDLEMPDPDGVTWELGGAALIKALRAEKAPESRICVLTAHDNPYLMETTVEIGADAHLTKHFDVDLLCDQILEVAKTIREDRADD